MFVADLQLGEHRGAIGDVGRSGALPVIVSAGDESSERNGERDDVARPGTRPGTASAVAGDPVVY